MHKCTVTSLHSNLHCRRARGDQNWKESEISEVKTNLTVINILV